MRTVLRDPARGPVTADAGPTHDARTALRVAYLVNQYPLVTHSFIRREIAALESMGVSVERYAIRTGTEPVVDPRDVAEQARTHTILSIGIVRLLLVCASRALLDHWRWVAALVLAIRLGWRSQRGYLRHLAYFVEACVLRRWTKVPHLHAHFATNALITAMLCQRLGGPQFSFTVHGPEIIGYERLRALRLAIAQARFVACVSWHGRSQLMRCIDVIHWSKLHVVHCGVDDRFLAEPVPIPQESRQLICVARLSHEKGHAVLLEAAHLLKQAGVSFQLLLVGDGDERPVIERLIREYGLNERVRLAGWLSGPDVRDAILASRALVLPSFEEGLPVVFMEALALGRPVISTYIAGIPELVRPARNGWLVPAGSAPELAVAVREALESPPTAMALLGAQGSADVREKHDSAKEARKLAGLFRAASGWTGST